MAEAAILQRVGLAKGFDQVLGNRLGFVFGLSFRIGDSFGPFPLVGFVLAGLLLGCRSAERSLRTPQDGDPPPVVRILRYLEFARHGLVWGITLLTMAIAISAGNDPACGG